MVTIDTPASLENFRKFIIASTCSSFAPQSYIEDTEVFAEREQNLGSIYVEAADKVTLKKNSRYYICKCNRCFRNNI